LKGSRLTIWERSLDGRFGDASDGRFDDGTDTQEGSSEAVDPCESSRRYVFGPTTVTGGPIWQLASLGYFSEGAM
jgi:hypothetical protein